MLCWGIQSLYCILLLLITVISPSLSLLEYIGHVILVLVANGQQVCHVHTFHSRDHLSRINKLIIIIIMKICKL